MKIFVTGASGFLGAHVCRRLAQQGHTLTRTNLRNCDLTHAGSLLQFNSEHYDQIYHLATWTQAGDFALRHPGEQWIINQQINTNVLAWWQAHQAQAKLICMGSSCAYAPDQELAEPNYLTGAPLDSLFTFAMTKRMLYVGLLALQKQFNLRYLCLVPATLYGPGYHTEDGRQRHFIFDLIYKIIRGKLYDEPVVLWGDGFQKRELLFVGDFVSIALQLAANYDNELINVGENVEFSIRRFAELICHKVGYDFGQIQFDTSRYVGATSKCLRTDKLRQIIPDLHFTSLDEGLAQTADWYWRQITSASGDMPA